MDFSQRISPVNGRRLMLVVLIVTILACRSVTGNANYVRCYTDGMDIGICVKREQCINGTIDTVGAFLITPRFQSNDIGECNEFGEICCGLPQTEPDSEETLNVASTSREDEPDDPDWSRQCGQRTNVSERTDPEYETNRFEFPWNVAIFSVTEFRRKRRKEFLCGGTLIDDYIVLTAARCVNMKHRTTLMVELGRWDLNAGEESRTQEIAVDQLIIHPGFKASSYVNNIALLMLDAGVQLGRAANRVCLADGSMPFDADSQCHVVGWSNSPTPKTGNRQLKLRSSFESAERCTESIRRATNAWEFVLPKENICPSYLDTNVPCERAPGSGLVCESTLTEGQFFLVGIASYAVRNCHQYRAYDVFLSIADYIEWIDRRVEEQNRETSFYRPDPIGFNK